MSNKKLGCYELGSFRHILQKRIFVNTRKVPSQVNDISDGEGVGKTFDVVREEHHCTIAISEVSGGFGSVH